MATNAATTRVNVDFVATFQFESAGRVWTTMEFLGEVLGNLPVAVATFVRGVAQYRVTSEDAVGEGLKALMVGVLASPAPADMNANERNWHAFETLCKVLEETHGAVECKTCKTSGTWGAKCCGVYRGSLPI